MNHLQQRTRTPGRIALTRHGKEIFKPPCVIVQPHKTEMNVGSASIQVRLYGIPRVCVAANHGTTHAIAANAQEAGGSRRDTLDSRTPSQSANCDSTSLRLEALEANTSRLPVVGHLEVMRNIPPAWAPVRIPDPGSVALEFPSEAEAPRGAAQAGQKQLPRGARPPHTGHRAMPDLPMAARRG